MSLARLETVLEHYGTIEQALSDQSFDRQVLEFKYDPNLDIEHTNLELKRTVDAFLVSKDKKVIEERIISDTVAISKKVGGRLQSLTESIHSKTEEICVLWQSLRLPEV